MSAFLATIDNALQLTSVGESILSNGVLTMGVSRKGLPFLFVVFVAAQSSPTWASTQVKEIFQLASDICSKIENAEIKADVLDESGISDRIKEYLSQSKLRDAAIQTIGDTEYYRKYFIQRARQLLETDLESDQFSFQQCRTKLVNMLVEDAITIQDAEDDDEKFSMCRHRYHGIVRRQRVEIFDRYSGWVWGGRDPRWWCARFIDVLSHQYPDAKYKVLKKRERVKKEIIFLKVRYNYYCKVEVTHDPMYKLARSPACPLEKNNK